MAPRALAWIIGVTDARDLSPVGATPGSIQPICTVCVNQLHRNPIFTGKPDNSVPPFLIARIWRGTKGQPGR